MLTALSRSPPDRQFLAIFACIALLCIAVYLPGLKGGFYFDDEPAIERNVALSNGTLLEAASSSKSGPTGRPVAMLSFALGARLHGIDPYWFKLTNLFIHLLAGLGLTLLTRRLAGVSSIKRDTAALAVGAVWMLHPINLTPVLYVVQRMTSLSALFVVLAVLCYIEARRRLLANEPGGVSRLLITLPLGALAVLSKENGILLPLYLFVIELCFFRFQGSSVAVRHLVLGYFLVILALPVILIAGFLWSHPEWIGNSYIGRPFTLSERLLTESHIVSWYLKIIVWPDLGEMGLILDDFTLARSLTKSFPTLVAVIFLGALITVAIAGLRRWPHISFGILWFFVGHLLESTIIPLELAYEHRNYLPSFGIVYVIVSLLFRLNLSSRAAILRVGFILVVVALFGFKTFTRADAWSESDRFILTEALNHPNSPRNNYFAGRVLHRLARQQSDPGMRQTLVQRGTDHLQRAIHLDPHMGSALIALICMQADISQNVDKALFKRLESVLAMPPLDAGTVNSMAYLSACARYAPQHIPVNVYLNLVDSLLKHGALSPRNQTLVLEFVANYHGKKRDFAEAIAVMRRAVRMSPEALNPQLRLVHWLVVSKRLDEAEIVLANVIAKDRWGRVSTQIREYRRVIQLLRTQPAAELEP